MNKQRMTVIFWASLILAVFFGLQSLFALRANNQESIQLRDQVLEVDKNNGDLEGALRELRTYVYSHMNTSLSSPNSAYPPVQLKYTYDRLVAAEKLRVEKASDDVYSKAQKYCENENSGDFSGRNRVPCIEKYVKARVVTEKPIEDDLYKFDFASPAWSADRAGITLALTATFAGLTVMSLLWGRLVRSQ
jgi:hypothetical protein